MRAGWRKGWWARLPLLLALVLLAAPAASAAPAQPATAPGGPPPETASVAEIKRLVATLQDPVARARLIAELQALLAAEHAAGSAPRAQAAPTPQAAGAAIGRFRRRLDTAANEILAGTAAVLELRHLRGWLGEQIADAAARRRWLDAFYAFALVFAPAIAIEAILRRVLARASPPVRARRGDSRPFRVLFAVFRLCLDALPIALFGAAAYGATALLPDRLTPAGPTLAVLVTATVEARLAVCLGRAVLVPAGSGAPLLPLEAATRNYLYTWLKRFVLVGFYGYAVPAAGWWLGIPGALYALLLKAAGLVLAVLAIVFVLQNRMRLGRRLGGTAGAGSGWGRLRRGFAEIWHLLAIVYILGLYLIYALHIAGGFAYLVRASLFSLVIVAAARLVTWAIARVRRDGVALSPELAARFPNLARRADRYLPIVGGLSNAAVCGFAGLAVLEAWGIDAFAWLERGLGRDLGSALLSTGLIVIAAIAVWEIFDAAIERYLGALEAGAAPARSRLPTLLRFLRTAALCVFAALLGLTVLSHLGIQIAPLLAGAGIVGVAIGFGSQSLVKDIITGLFMLVEDQLAVGDIVDVGNGHSGVVEAITVRTLRLRDSAGAVHTLPFSAVATVKNLTKDFAYVVARVTISYREDIDRVVAILRQVCDELAADEALAPLILDPFDYQGVDSLDEFWVTLQLRIRTLPAQQFVVGRAFNRLLKIAFDRHGVTTRDPNSMVLAGTPPAAVEQSRLEPERRRA
jgi:small conductance mechanosensitive channel